MTAFNKRGFLKWLKDCKGKDVHVFLDALNNPAIEVARNFAEDLRAKIGSSCPEVSIEQSYHRVTILLTLSEVCQPCGISSGTSIQYPKPPQGGTGKS